MTRNFATSADVDAALEFLGKEETPPMTGGEYFTKVIGELIKEVNDKAVVKRFSLVNSLMSANLTPHEKISKLRDLLGA